MNARAFYGLSLLIPLFVSDGADLKEEAERSLRNGVSFFYSINAHGGYVYHVLPDLSQRWGEGPKDADTVEVQPPGTPAVGRSFLQVYQTIGDPKALLAAK